MTEDYDRITTENAQTIVDAIRCGGGDLSSQHQHGRHGLYNNHAHRLCRMDESTMRRWSLSVNLSFRDMDREPYIIGYSRDHKGKVIGYHLKTIANTLHCSCGTFGNTAQYVYESLEQHNRTVHPAATENRGGQRDAEDRD